jgi:caffeoyl-CoA O-methyltransferase
MSENNREAIHQYVNDLFAPEDDVLAWISTETARNGLPTIGVQPFEGRLLQWLIQVIDARKVVEIGTLAGYSGVWMARALPADGQLITLEASSKHAQVARASFERAGVSDRVELIEGDAHASMEMIRGRGPFDMVFIDADKVSYPHYLVWAVDNVRAGGLVAAHNALRPMRAGLDSESADNRGVATFNQQLAADERLESLLLPVGDGMAVGIKRTS